MTPDSDSRPALWLASGSPRRRELLEQAGFVIAGRAHPSGPVDESLLPGEVVDSAVLRLARAKLHAALAAPSLPAGAVLLAADTLVAGPDGRPMGKPVDAADAEAMIATLSGQWHRVITAVAVGDGQAQRDAVVESRLRFARLSAETIRAYAATGEPLDKAGGYGLQGRAGSFVEAIDGDCSAVIGLPLAATSRLLASFDLRPAWMERGDMDRGDTE
ncbi:septum formation protein Maf [Guyparkeria sp. SCN-R1]|uniref:Maf family protein n=1 Tax=unclassified Guyparkeria TaxID=2626246 RepID=UPI000F648DA7|nr:Maf family protein [Guyparkeria sp. SCN-R1]RRQ23324.1 septum formation protein Maf [Guyparkeria sp. SCN-R1]